MSNSRQVGVWGDADGMFSGGGFGWDPHEVLAVLRGGGGRTITVGLLETLAGWLPCVRMHDTGWHYDSQTIPWGLGMPWALTHALALALRTTGGPLGVLSVCDSWSADDILRLLTALEHAGVGDGNEFVEGVTDDWDV